MAMQARNHIQSFRPLRGGIAISNGNGGRLGTLGCMVTSDGADRWILSAHHVLRGAGPELGDDEPVFQPALGGADLPVARTRRARASPELDAAAALIVDNIGAVNEILGIGAVGPLAEPVEGARVIKSGVATGITEGQIIRVVGDDVRIELLRGYPSKYELSAISDSGAIWLDQDTLSPVALHVAGNDTGIEIAVGVRLSAVLRALGLRMLD
jgi:hypothetical protein